MMRIRTVKPELFKHDELFDLERETGLPIRLAWIGLFCYCDREGRFPWKPRPMKAEILPYDDDVDFFLILDALESKGFIVRYAVDGETFGRIPKWKDHQVINNKEAKSKLPPPPDTQLELDFNLRDDDASATREARVNHATGTRPPSCLRGKEGKGRELERKGKGKEEEGSNGTTFGVRDEFVDNPTLREVLQAISPSVQKAWVERYEIGWLKQKLLDAIAHHLNKENAANPSEIRDWGLRLVKWLRYEKKPLLIESGANLDAELEAFEAEIQKNGGVTP